MSHRPVCVKCQREMECLKNEVGVVDTHKNHDYDELWLADMWECKKCGNEIVMGFGRAPIADATLEKYQEWIAGLTNIVINQVEEL